MLFPTYILVLFVAFVNAVPIFRSGNASVAVNKIRDGTDFATAVSGKVPADATKGLSVSTNLVAPKQAKKVLDAFAATKVGDAAAKKTAAKALNTLLDKNFAKNVYTTDSANFPATDFALKDDPNTADPGHKLLTLVTETTSTDLLTKLNAPFGSKLSLDQIETTIKAQNPGVIGVAPVAAPAPAPAAGSSSGTGTGTTAPAKPVKPTKPAKGGKGLGGLLGAIEGILKRNKADELMQRMAKRTL